MYTASDLRKGLKVIIDDEPYIVTAFEFSKPGKGQALYRTKLRNMITGLTIDRTYLEVLLFRDRAIGVELPNFVNLRVIKTEPWVRGDTSKADFKPATLETGYVLRVPPFIEEGELITIDTRTGDFSKRVKE